MIIILKNISNNVVNINDLGFSLGIGESRQVYTDEGNFEFSLSVLQSSIDLHNVINENKVIINNGINDLTKENSLKIIESASIYDVSQIGGLNESQHLNLNTLVHNLYKNNYKEITRENGLISRIDIWNDINKTFKIRDYIITRVNNLIVSITERQYNEMGEVIQIIFSNYNRTNGLVNNIIETIL
ncbi:MAG: hypothetical protein SNJ64_04155 [Endomicrobiia bacterium]